MTIPVVRRTLSVACLTVAGLAFAVAPAQAAPGDAFAEGAAGAATVGTATVPPIAPCSTEESSTSQSGPVVVPGVVSYSSGASTCTIDEAGENATTTVTGGRFRLDALQRYGGPRIRLSSYAARCEANLDGSRSWIQFSGLAGVRVPSRLPVNHVVTIPGGPDGRPMATVTFNESVFPPDGSMTVHLMHVRLFPQGGPTSGDVYVGSVHCVPVP